MSAVPWVLIVVGAVMTAIASRRALRSGEARRTGPPEVSFQAPPPLAVAGGVTLLIGAVLLVFGRG